MAGRNWNSPRGSHGGGGALHDYWSYHEPSPEEQARNLAEARRKSLIAEITNGKTDPSTLVELDARLLCEQNLPLIRRIEEGSSDLNDWAAYRSLAAQDSVVARQLELLREEVRTEIAAARQNELDAVRIRLEPLRLALSRDPADQVKHRELEAREHARVMKDLGNDGQRRIAAVNAASADFSFLRDRQFMVDASEVDAWRVRLLCHRQELAESDAPTRKRSECESVIRQFEAAVSPPLLGMTPERPQRRRY